MEPARTLLDLQDRDLALLRYEKELDEMPEKRAILTVRAKLADIEKLRGRAAAGLAAMDAAVRGAEDRIATLAAKMEAEQAKLLSGEIANPKELQSVSLELDSLRKRKDALESELLESMEKRETAAAQVAKIDAALAEGRRREADLTEHFKERGSEILAHIEEEKRARTLLAAALGADLLAKYEASREHHGTGAGRLDQGRCSACRVGLPAGKVAALEAGPEIGTCPNCGRLLVVRGA